MKKKISQNDFDCLKDGESIVIRNSNINYVVGNMYTFKNPKDKKDKLKVRCTASFFPNSYRFKMDEEEEISSQKPKFNIKEQIGMIKRVFEEIYCKKFYQISMDESDVCIYSEDCGEEENESYEVYYYVIFNTFIFYTEESELKRLFTETTLRKTSSTTIG